MESFHNYLGYRLSKKMYIPQYSSLNKTEDRYKMFISLSGKIPKVIQIERKFLFHHVGWVVLTVNLPGSGLT